MAAPEPESSAADLPVPETGMDFDLFGPSAESPSAQPSVQPTPQAAPTAGGSPTATPVVPTLGAEQLQQLMLQMLNNQNTALQQQQNQMNFLMQAQSAQLTLLTRRFDEEEARRKADEARRAVSADPFAAASAGGTSAAPTTSPVAPPGVPATASFSSGATSSFGGRAEKYLPSLPLINHGEMRAGRIRELEEFHRFLEVLSSWLALTDDAFVPELRQCLFVPNEIQQVSLPSDTAGRSAKLFYLLQQALAKWDRGLEILRSVSTRQGNAAAGYEGVRELYRQYSVNSRMEAVYIRDEMLKLHTKTGSLRRPLEVVRFLEDEISKGEKKLVRFPDLCLNAADKSAILLQAVSVQVVCWYCGKAGHYQEDCRQKIADDKKRHPKGDSGKGKDKGDHGKTGREKPDPKGKGKGKDSKGKGKGKGKDKGKKDKRVRAVGEGSVDQEEPEGECLMALREGELIPTGVLRTTTPTPAEHQVRLVGVEQQDAYWLVDSGATSHCMSFSCFEKYDVLRTYDHKPTLSNASNETIEVMKVCDVRVRFGKQVVVLEHCLITNLDFNVLSPFVAWQRGWHTMLTNSPHIYNKKNKKRIRLTVKDRAWYAVATLKDGGDQMELDVVQQKPPAAAQAKSKPEKPEAKPKERRALESVKSLEYTPFKFLLRSLRTTRPVFSHPPLPKEKQAKLEQSRASFAQRVSEARAKAAGLLLSARDHVASAVAASGLPETANLTESDCSDTTEWWRNRVRGATSIEEINRLQVNFRKLKQLEEESAVIVSSGSEEEWEQDSAARVEYFRGKVLRMFDEASRVATSSGVGSEEHGESSSPTVDVLVNPTSEYVGYWSPATTSEPTPGAEMAPQTPSPPGVIAPGAEFIPETPPPSGMMASGATGSLAAKAVLEKAAAKALLESLVREQERQDREQFPPRFLAPTPKVRSIASKTSDPKPSRKASVPKPSKKAGTPEPVPAATSAPEPEPVQPKRRLPPPRAVASTGATAKPASTLLSPPPPPAPIYPTPRVEPMLVHPMQPRMHVVSGCRVKLSFRVSCTWVSGSGRGKDAQIEGESRLACVGEKVDGNDVVNPEPHLVRAMRHRGLPVVDLEDEEELIPDPESAGAGDVVEPEGQEEQEGTGDLYVPLSDDQYVEHVARGHQPYLPSCSLCVSSRGVIPARRRKDPQIPQASFLSDFLFFTKDLRVCLIQHELSGYLVGIPYATGEEPSRVVKQICAEMHYCMKGQHVVLRMDNEHSLQALWNKVARDKSFPGLSLHIDSVAKGRPQQKGQVEVGVRHFKEAFWVNWLTLETSLSKKLSLGGLLYKEALRYVGRPDDVEVMAAFRPDNPVVYPE
ncbi:unnamed protein product, partial [Symbiodinium microadriaticum]